MDGELVTHRIVDHDEWLVARLELLEAEKEFTRRRDALSRARRELPWERVQTEYVFATPSGERTLSDLFAGRSQLIVYHFMFSPDDEWTEACKHCSFWADNFNPNVVHLQARDVTFVAVSRAQVEKIELYRARMGWTSPGCRRTTASSTTPSASRSATTSATSRSSTRHDRARPRRSRGRVGLPQGRGGVDLPHLLDVRAWDRPAERGVQLPRPRSTRTRRGGTAATSTGSAATTSTAPKRPVSNGVLARNHSGIVIPNPRRFPQGPASIGPLIESLDELIAGRPLYESFIHWLQ